MIDRNRTEPSKHVIQDLYLPEEIHSGKGQVALNQQHYPLGHGRPLKHSLIFCTRCNNITDIISQVTQYLLIEKLSNYILDIFTYFTGQNNTILR